MDMRRIDVPSVPAVFARVGMRPRRFVWGRDDGDEGGPCGCLLTALYLDATGLTARDLIQRRVIFDDPIGACAEALGVATCYAQGLADGWDGCDARTGGGVFHRYPPLFGSEAYELGHDDGRAAWSLCGPAHGEVA